MIIGYINLCVNIIGYVAIAYVLWAKIQSLKERIDAKDSILGDIRKHLDDWDKALGMYKTTFSTLHENYPKDLQMIRDLSEAKIQMYKDLAEARKVIQSTT